MKKTFVTVTLFVAMAVAANAAERQHDSEVSNMQAQVTNEQTADDQDIYRDYVLNSEENDKHIIRFYDIDRIVIENKHHAVIRIYDDKWRLIEKTTSDVDKSVREGNYYVTCSTKIKGHYMH